MRTLVKYQPRPEIMEEVTLNLMHGAETRGLAYDDVVQIVADTFEWTITEAHIYIEGVRQGPLQNEKN